MDKNGIDHIIAINNAWKISSNWDELIYPEDFPISRRPYTNLESKKLTSADTYVEAQNEYGGFVYAGGTMAFTAGYYALSRYKPKTIAFIGCDMVYPEKGKTHFKALVFWRELLWLIPTLMLHSEYCSVSYTHLTLPTNREV